mgnify:CR=1 FL=1
MAKNEELLMKGNCLERMKEIETDSVDMALVDPPYETTSCKWDKIIDLSLMWEQLSRIVKLNGSIAIMASQPFTSKLIMSNPDWFRYCWYWEKERLTNIAQVKKRPGKTIEEICVFYKKQPTYNPQMVKHNGPKRTNKVKNGKMGELTDINQKNVKEYNDTGYRYPTQVLKFQRDTLKLNLHPTQKPLALMEYLIKTYTNENDSVIDFAMGSGTTGVACVNLNRQFIGIELDENYFNIAKERIENAKSE